MSPPSLESCIASSLVSDDIKSSDLAKLITETEGAIAAADKAAEEERERALDPIASPDATKARETLQAAEFTRDRLKTVLPRLQKRHNELQELEYYAAWRADFERVEAKRCAGGGLCRDLPASGGAARRSSPPCRGLRSRGFAHQPYGTIRCSGSLARGRADGTRDRAAAAARY